MIVDVVVGVVVCVVVVEVESVVGGGSGVVLDVVLQEEPYNVARAVTGTSTVLVSVTIRVEMTANDEM